MDEYLFTVLAKLQADRQKLQQEQLSAQLPQPQARTPRSRELSELPPDVLSIVPTHGLRGWS